MAGAARAVVGIVRPRHTERIRHHAGWVGRRAERRDTTVRMGTVAGCDVLAPREDAQGVRTSPPLKRGIFGANAATTVNRRSSESMRCSEHASRGELVDRRQFVLGTLTAGASGRSVPDIGVVWPRVGNAQKADGRPIRAHGPEAPSLRRQCKNPRHRAGASAPTTPFGRTRPNRDLAMCPEQADSADVDLLGARAFARGIQALARDKDNY